MLILLATFVFCLMCLIFIYVSVVFVVVLMFLFGVFRSVFVPGVYVGTLLRVRICPPSFLRDTIFWFYQSQNLYRIPSRMKNRGGHRVCTAFVR